MDNRPLFQARWSLGPLAACTLLPIALLCFWLWPIGQILCLTFDEWLFHSLNAPLADSTTWRYIWTVGSLRPFDIVVGLILLAVLIRGDWVFKAAQVRQAFFGFLVTLLLLVVIRALFSKWVDAAGWQHKSPSMMFDDVVHLSDYYPNLEAAWELKDRSSKSFPGGSRLGVADLGAVHERVQPPAGAVPGDLGAGGAVHVAAPGGRRSLGAG